MAVHHQVIRRLPGMSIPIRCWWRTPPPCGCRSTAEVWPENQPVRAGVSAMGFGGINAHVVVAGDGGVRRTGLDARTIRLVELPPGQRTAAARRREPGGPARPRWPPSRSCPVAWPSPNSATSAATLARECGGANGRAAVVAASPDQAEQRLGALLEILDSGTSQAIDVAAGVFLGGGTGTARIGYMFPGQGSGRGTDGALRRRFSVVQDLYQEVAAPAGGDMIATAAAQPRIATSSVAGLRVLSLLGIEAEGAVGHSLGELSALHWAGAMDESALLALAAERGRVMAEASDGGGAMAGIAAGPDLLEPLLAGAEVVIAGYNGPGQTVISGPAEAVERVRCAAAVACHLQDPRLARLPFARRGPGRGRA